MDRNNNSNPRNVNEKQVAATAPAGHQPPATGRLQRADRVRLFEGEQKLMELLWENDGATAKELTRLAADTIGWNKNTTYTVIKKLVSKGAIKREEPGFVCRSLIGREETGREEVKAAVRSFFGGSVKAMFSSFMADATLSDEEAEDLRRMIDSRSGGAYRPTDVDSELE